MDIKACANGIEFKHQKHHRWMSSWPCAEGIQFKDQKGVIIVLHWTKHPCEPSCTPGIGFFLIMRTCSDINGFFSIAICSAQCKRSLLPTPVNPIVTQPISQSIGFDTSTKVNWSWNTDISHTGVVGNDRLDLLPKWVLVGCSVWVRSFGQVSRNATLNVWRFWDFLFLFLFD